METASKWLKELGYPGAIWFNTMKGRINEWWALYTNEDDFYTQRTMHADGTEHRIAVRSMTPARMVCEDMAGILFNETAEIGVGGDGDGLEASAAYLESWLEESAFCDTAPLLIQRACATGTAAWSLRFEGVDPYGPSPALRIVPQRYDARNIFPLTFTEDDCSECAFRSTAYVGGKVLTQMQAYVVGDGGYDVHTAFFDATGARVQPDGYATVTHTRSALKPFAIIRLAIDNPYWEGSPFGVSLFDSAVGAIKNLDASFNNINADIVLGEKMVFMPRGMVRKAADGTLLLPMDEGKRLFVATEGSTVGEDGLPKITDYNPDLRAEDNRRMLDTCLQVLGKRVGFGMRYYALDDAGGIKTAKEVASDNSEMMRTIRKHEHFIVPAVKGICEAVIACANGMGGAGLPDITGKVSVVMGDSIIQDSDEERRRDREDVSMGALPIEEYIMKWRAVDLATAQKWAQEASEQSIRAEES